MSLSNLFQPNKFNLYSSTLDNFGSLVIGKNALTTDLHLGDTATPVYINELPYVRTTPLTIASVGTAPNVNGMTLASNVLNLQPADITNPGVVSTGTQTLTGQKTFNTGVQFTNAIVSYIPATLNYYEVFTTSYALSGCASVTFNVTWTRIGNLVNLTWLSANSGLGIATTVAGTLSTPSSTVPTRFLASNYSACISVINGSTNTTLANGNIFFLSGGAISITGGGNSAFPFPGYCGFQAGSITYTV